MTSQHVAAFGTSFASNDVHSLQNLHNLKQELERNAATLRDILDANRSIAVVIHGEFQHGGAGVFVLRRDLHRPENNMGKNILDGPNLSRPEEKLTKPDYPGNLTNSQFPILIR